MDDRFEHLTPLVRKSQRILFDQTFDESALQTVARTYIRLSTAFRFMNTCKQDSASNGWICSLPKDWPE